MLGTIKQYIRSFAQIMFYTFHTIGNVNLLSQLQQSWFRAGACACSRSVG